MLLLPVLIGRSNCFGIGSFENRSGIEMVLHGIINFAFPLSCAKQTFSQDSFLIDLPLQQRSHWLSRSCSAGVALGSDSVSLESYFYSIQRNSLTFKIMVGFIGTQRLKCHLQEQDSSTCSSTSRDPSQQ